MNVKYYGNAKVLAGLDILRKYISDHGYDFSVGHDKIILRTQRPTDEDIQSLREVGWDIDNELDDGSETFWRCYV